MWPPKYVNTPMALLLDDEVPNGAFRFGCKLYALAWGEPTLSIPIDQLMHHTGLRQSQVYEYARTLRDHHKLLSYDVRNGAFECSFPEMSEIPENPEMPIKYLNPLVKNTVVKANSGKTGISGKVGKVVKPAAVEAFRSAAKCWPAKAQWPAIDSAVGADPARLELWGKVVAGYILKGWNPRNVAGMLEFFNRGEVPGANGHAPASKPTPGFRLPDGV